MTIPVPPPTPTPSPAADLSGLLAPPVLAWLAAKGFERASWLMPADDRGLIDPSQVTLDFDFGIGSDPLQKLGLRLVFAASAVLTETDKAAVSAYFAALGPFLQDEGPGDVDRVVILPRETLLAVEHQLRNHLNSLLMNAAAITLKCDEHGDLAQYLVQMESDSQSCLDLLHWISDRVT
jgi:hypothetical protein